MNRIKHGDGWVIIGVDHGQPILLKNKDLDQVLAVLRTSGKVWIEGIEAEAVVADFIRKYLPRAQMLSWEPSHDTPLILNLFGGETDIILDQISWDSNFDSRKNIIDNLVATQASWHDGIVINKQDIQKLLRLENMEADSMKSFDHFESFHRKGFRLTWESGGTAFSKLAAAANQARIDSIKDKMERFGGVFFAGSSHLDEINEAVQRLFLKLVIMECFSKC